MDFGGVKSSIIMRHGVPPCRKMLISVRYIGVLLVVVVVVVIVLLAQLVFLVSW